MELRNAISSHFGAPCPATLAFDYPTASALAAFVASHAAASQPELVVSTQVRAPLSLDLQRRSSESCFINTQKAARGMQAVKALTIAPLLQGMQLSRHEAAPAVSAVWGMAARYPGVPSCAERGTGIDSFWASLQASANLPCVVPTARWDVEELFAPDLLPGKMCGPPHILLDLTSMYILCQFDYDARIIT